MLKKINYIYLVPDNQPVQVQSDGSNYFTGIPLIEGWYVLYPPYKSTRPLPVYLTPASVSSYIAWTTTDTYDCYGSLNYSLGRSELVCCSMGYGSERIQNTTGWSSRRSITNLKGRILSATPLDQRSLRNLSTFATDVFGFVKMSSENCSCTGTGNVGKPCYQCSLTLEKVISDGWELTESVIYPAPSTTIIADCVFGTPLTVVNKSVAKYQVLFDQGGWQIDPISVSSSLPAAVVVDLEPFARLSGNTLALSNVTGKIVTVAYSGVADWGGFSLINGKLVVGTGGSFKIKNIVGDVVINTAGIVITSVLVGNSFLEI